MNQQTSVVKTYLCEKCGYESKSLDEYRKHKADHVLGKIEGSQTLVVEEKAENKPIEKPVTETNQPKTDRKPIKLTYLYEGQCETCGKEVTTLEMDVKSEHFVLAYCTACREKKAERKATKL